MKKLLLVAVSIVSFAAGGFILPKVWVKAASKVDIVTLDTPVDLSISEVSIVSPIFAQVDISPKDSIASFQQLEFTVDIGGRQEEMRLGRDEIAGLSITADLTGIEEIIKGKIDASGNVK